MNSETLTGKKEPLVWVGGGVYEAISNPVPSEVDCPKIFLSSMIAANLGKSALL